MTLARPVVCIIAGTDSSGAAGLHADVRAVEALGAHAAAVVTAVTAQTVDAGVGAAPVAAEQVEAQLRAVLRLRPAAVKIGMIGSEAAAQAVAEVLRDATPQAPAVILDPVLAATSGLPLADAAARAALLRELLPLATLVSPNLPEAEALTGLRIGAAAEVREAARALLAAGARAVLIKGGHEGDKGHEGHSSSARRAIVSDYFTDGAQAYWISSPRYPASARGTGCALASAVAAAIAGGDELGDALVRARAVVSRALRLAADRVLRPEPWAAVGYEDLPWITLGDEPPVREPEAFADCRARPGAGEAALSALPLGLYPVVDRAAWIARLAPLGVSTIQLRVKDLTGDALAREVEAATHICRAHGVRLFVNDHWRLAIRCGAYGVHLGQEDLQALTPGADLAALRAAGLRLGISTHSLHEAAVAHGVRPSYVALGPIFATTCKSMRFGPQGFARLAEWRRLFAPELPLVAIGGLKVEHAPAVLAAGVTSAAVVSDVLQAAAPEDRARAWMAAMDTQAAGAPS